MAVQRCNFDMDKAAAPIYRNHQLLGDSQLVRFSEQILALKPSFIKNGRGSKKARIGFCVSGQTIEELENRLASNYYNVHDQVILLIGTNDMLCGTTFKKMCQSYEEIVANLVEKCHNIVLLTIPPIPKLGNADNVVERLVKFNQFIKNLGETSEKIYVVDLASACSKIDNTPMMRYYEKTFYPSNREDLIHLNMQAFKVMCVAMDVFYFSIKK